MLKDPQAAQTDSKVFNTCLCTAKLLQIRNKWACPLFYMLTCHDLGDPRNLF